MLSGNLHDLQVVHRPHSVRALLHPRDMRLSASRLGNSPATVTKLRMWSVVSARTWRRESEAADFMQHARSVPPGRRKTTPTCGSRMETARTGDEIGNPISRLIGSTHHDFTAPGKRQSYPAWQTAYETSGPTSLPRKWDVCKRPRSAHPGKALDRCPQSRT
ncbi:hypothetical protein BU23DRAFT_569494 [Bimuria novae-zelandiae CBS 107.79]|uniref:Uncharacterized protein n=1 Tax=Bimuria novae-zelandiae CBS 107.79 TaxID=1447943 RepID=A0A6A5VFH6_9PLEO|nr:hypothetical protein BU23DRAFT_569494 [Bimuria novae-zelandiae CBS 107.79]